MFLEAMNKYEPRVTKESKGCATISVGEFFDFLSVHPLLKKTPCSLFGTNHQEMLDEFYLTKFERRPRENDAKNPNDGIFFPIREIFA